MKALLSRLQDRADCRRRSVAAVVVRDGEVVGQGWNGLESGSCLAGECPRGFLSYDEAPARSSYSNCHAVHAEVAALREAGELARGAVLYVTAVPCAGCTIAIASHGVAAVVVETDSPQRGTATAP